MKHRRKPQRRLIDKVKAYELYITPNEDGTLKTIWDVADTMGVSRDYMEKISSREGWVENRKKVGKLAIAQIELATIENQGKLNKELYNGWSLFLASIRKSMIKQLEEEKLGARSVKDLSDAFKNTTDKLRVLSGQVTDISKSSVDATLTNGDSITEEDVKAFNRFLGKKTDSDETPKKPDVAPTQ